MDNDRCKCAGAKLEAGKQLSLICKRYFSKLKIVFLWIAKCIFQVAMDNDRWKCAGAKLEAEKQLIPAAAAFLPAVSTSSTLLPSSSSILST